MNEGKCWPQRKKNVGRNNNVITSNCSSIMMRALYRNRIQLEYLSKCERQSFFILLRERVNTIFVAVVVVRTKETGPTSKIRTCLLFSRFDSWADGGTVVIFDLLKFS
jgi:hypothetical protein